MTVEYLDKTGLSYLWSKIKTTFATKSVRSVTLTTSGWSASGDAYVQTVNVSGMTANSVVLVTPDVSTGDSYSEFGVMAVAQASGTLTFKAYLLPNVSLKVNILNMGDGQ